MAKVINLFSRNEEVLEKVDVNNFRVEIVRPALQLCGLWSEAAENLMIGTALAESGLQWVRQIGGGRGLSFLQIEPDTYNDILRYLHRPDNKLLKERVLSACFMDVFPDAKCLVWNIRLAVLIARVIYWRRPEPLPDANNPEKLGQYWKKHYNSDLGKGTIDHFIKAWEARIQ